MRGIRQQATKALMLSGFTREEHRWCPMAARPERRTQLLQKKSKVACKRVQARWPCVWKATCQTKSPFRFSKMIGLNRFGSGLIVSTEMVNQGGFQ